MLLGFKKRFITPIQLGTKVHTMRKPPKRTPKIGETLYMYSALRTKHCVHISSKEKLVSIQKVRIKIYKISNYQELYIWIDGKPLEDINRLVRFDGFEALFDFVHFWVAESPVKIAKDGAFKVNEILNLYHWTDLRY